MPMFLAADFPNRQATARALLDFQSQGFATSDLDVFSDSPIEFPRHVLHRPSRMSLAVVTGAIAACLLIIGFVYFTQYNYPIVTGGMPIFSFWATGVVFYEITMLGATVTSFFWFLWESGLLRPGRTRFAPIIKPGMIAVRVACAPDRCDSARRLLVDAGATDIRTLGEGT